MGETGIAGNDEVGSFLLNPALLPHMKQVLIGGGYLWGRRDNLESLNRWSVLVGDNSKESMFPGGLSYIRKSRTLEGVGKFNQQSASFSAAEFFAKHLSFGLTLAWQETKNKIGLSEREINASFGAHYNPYPQFAVGFVYNHFAGGNGKLHPRLRLPKSLGVGATWLYSNILRLRGDVSYFPTTREDAKVAPTYYSNRGNASNGEGVKPWAYAFGMESLWTEWTFFRLGYRKEMFNLSEIVSVGLGLQGPSFQMNYSLSKNTTSGSRTMHGVDLALLF